MKNINTNHSDRTNLYDYLNDTYGFYFCDTADEVAYSLEKKLCEIITEGSIRDKYQFTDSPDENDIETGIFFVFEIEVTCLDKDNYNFDIKGMIIEWDGDVVDNTSIAFPVTYRKCSV